MQPRIPCATYRLQFNHAFTFRDAARIIAYLHDLGVTDIYSSPYLKAKKGSLHGYDIVDPQVLNPEVGTDEDYAAMAAELSRHGMGQVLDIVPNHMCVDSPENLWWRDVLENGPSSPHAGYFDIDWAPIKKELRNKVLIPVLGDQYGNILEGQELRLAFEEGAFAIHYYDHSFPLRPQTYALVLEHRIGELQALIPAGEPDLSEFLSIVTALRHLPSYTETDPDRIAERHREKEVIKRRLWTLFSGCEQIRAHVEENVRIFNGQKGEPRSFDLLDDLMNQQIYRLSYWRVATEEINYRRFFDVDALGAIRMENPAVFAEAHALVFRLIREGSVTGLRVDHPDGLYNPVEYFHRLQRGCFVLQQRVMPAGQQDSGSSPEAGEQLLAQQYDDAVIADPGFKPFYIVGEKILIKSERMPDDWPIFSTTGYVFVNSVNGIFVDGAQAKAFDAVYDKYTRTKFDVHDVIYEKKKLVMQVAMSSEVNTLGHYLNDISEKNRHTRDFTLHSLTGALIEVIALFPVYRTYTNTWVVNDRDRQVIEQAVAKAKRRNPAISESIFDFVRDVLLLRFPREFSDREKAEWLDFVMRFQQLSGPIMAKGVEDTAFYVYNRLVSLNEVGGAPERFGTALETFHGQNIERRKFWPHALIATSTHDTKRSEDVRARINVLSEMPREWGEQIRSWARLNKKRKAVIEGQEVPDRNEEYLLYQTLIGVWPVEASEGSTREDLAQRIKNYMLKALREAKQNTSWISPNQRYEEAVMQFINGLVQQRPGNRFLNEFLPFQRMISHYGMFNSLSQTLLKICAPGVPDFYQGTELWDFSLVDPDNRRPVDYGVRTALLSELKQKQQSMTGVDLAWDLALNKDDGRIKLYLVHKALGFRREHRELFEKGDYLPLEARGARADHVCAFERTSGQDSLIAAVPRFLSRIIGGPGALPFGKAVWEDTRLFLPETNAGVHYQNIFTGEVIGAVPDQGMLSIDLAAVFATFPVALLERLPRS